MKINIYTGIHHKYKKGEFVSEKDNHGLAILILVLAVGSVGILQLMNFSITGYASQDKCIVKQEPLQVLCKDGDGDGIISFPIAAKAYKSAGMDPKEARGMQSIGGGKYTSGEYEIEPEYEEIPADEEPFEEETDQTMIDAVNQQIQEEETEEE